MGNAISTKDVVNAQMQLQKGMEKAKTTEEMMDQMRSAFDASFTEMAPAEMESAGISEDDLDKVIAEMSEKKDTLSEDTITQLLNKTASQT